MVAVVERALARRSGARGLRAILEAVMLDIMFELPSRRGVSECVITEECVRDGKPPLLTGSKNVPVAAAS
jgi:ATP-dependent Clp protease ATP-binding subunit ClpX